MIYHITTTSRWTELASHTDFSPEAYAHEKFIHCCEYHQLQGVLERYFKGASSLLLLCLDETKLKAPVRYEPATNQELFAHVYGTINKDAIVEIRPIQPYR